MPGSATPVWSLARKLTAREWKDALPDRPYRTKIPPRYVSGLFVA
jgi:hypothetical protein